MSAVKTYNIILLGETGAGKSSFINSFANFSQHSTFGEAIAGKQPITLIPSTFKIVDENDAEHTISAGGNDTNERNEAGKSFTKNCKSYQFHLGDDVIVRLMDTPGMKDTDGEEVDREHIANILSFINNFDNLHAIGIVLKNSENRMSENFSQCLKMLLTNLNKKAVNNIVFILTFSKTNNFKPGPIKDVIKLFIDEEIKDSSLRLDKTTMFCFDNKCYEYLIAVNRGVIFDEMDIYSETVNWKCSSNETARLVIYISDLNPYNVQDSRCLSDARDSIKIIYPVLMEILKTIDKNAATMNEYENDLRIKDFTVENLKSDISLKMEGMKTIPIQEAITFCVSNKCRRVMKVGKEERYDYPQQCCVGCTVSNKLNWFCDAMDWTGYCRICACHCSAHDRRFYRMEKITLNVFTEEGIRKMKMATDAKQLLEIKIEEIKKTKAQLLHEKNVIQDAATKFAKFLLTHALVTSEKNREEFQVMDKFDREIKKMNYCISVDDFYELQTTLINLPIYGTNFENALETNSKQINNSATTSVESVIKGVKKLFFKN